MRFIVNDCKNISNLTGLPLPRRDPQGKKAIVPRYSRRTRMGSERKRIDSGRKSKWPMRDLPVMPINIEHLCQQRSVPMTQARNELQGIDGSSVLATALRTSGYGESSSTEIVRLCTMTKIYKRGLPRTPTIASSRSMFGSSKSAMVSSTSVIK